MIFPDSHTNLRMQVSYFIDKQNDGYGLLYIFNLIVETILDTKPVKRHKQIFKSLNFL